MVLCTICAELTTKHFLVGTLRFCCTTPTAETFWIRRSLGRGDLIGGWGGRKAILGIYARNKPFAKEVDWEAAARRTVGFSGADLENMLNEAAITAARENKKQIGMEEIEEAATKG